MTALARAGERVRPGHLVFLANFALAKAAVYVIPLLLAAVSSDLLYGRIELGLAIGLQASALVLGASLSGITQLYLVRGERGFGNLLILLTLIPTSALLLAGVATWLAGGSALTVLVIATMSATVFQNTASTWFRIRGQRNHTAWADGASLLIVGAAALVAVLVAGRDAVEPAAALLLGATAILTAASTAAWLQRGRSDGGMIDRVRRSTMVGFPMMIAGIFAIWIGVEGRILIGVLSATDLAAYSLAFRIGGLTLGLHQLATTAMFPKLYASRVRPGDRLLSALLTGVLGFSILLLLVAPHLPGFIHFSALSGNALVKFQSLIAPAVFQTFFWISFALLQSRINRFGVAKRSIIPIMLVTAAGIGGIFLTARTISNDVRLISWLIAAHAAAYFLVAHFILYQRGIPHVRTAIVAATGGLLLAGISAVEALW